MEELIKSIKIKYPQFLQLRVDENFKCWIYTSFQVKIFNSLDELRTHLNE